MKEWDLKDEWLTIKLPVEVDHFAATEIRKTDELFVKHQVRYVVFDFQQTDFMDSSGIGLITGRYRQVINSNGKVYVRNLKPSIEKVFLMSGLHQIVEMEDRDYE